MLFRVPFQVLATDNGNDVVVEREEEYEENREQDEAGKKQYRFHR